MLQTPWRSRFTSRLVRSVSKTAMERAADRPRLFPYSIIDQLKPAPRVILKQPRPQLVSKEKKAPTKAQTLWYFIKRT
jgi:hypothetical protein